MQERKQVGRQVTPGAVCPTSLREESVTRDQEASVGGGRGLGVESAPCGVSPHQDTSISFCYESTL